jgi:hypothetical protein
MVQWLLFGGAPLLVVIWITIASMRATEPDRLGAIGRAASQGCAALIVIYGLAGAVLLLWLTVSTVTS